MNPEQIAEKRIAGVQATAASFEDAQRDALIAETSHDASLGFGAAIAAQGGPLGLAIFGAGLAGGKAGSWVAEKTGAPELVATAFEAFGMRRLGEGGTQAATVTHKIAHSYSFLGLIAGLVVGAVAALAVGALIVATGGAAAVVLVGAAAAGGFAGGFLGTAVGGGLSKMGAVSGAITTGSLDTFIGGLPVARMTDIAACTKEPAPSPMVEGSKTVFVNSLPMVRVGHKLACGASVDEGFSTVFLDDTTAACAAAASEVPLWAQVAADWVMFLPAGKVAQSLSRRAPRSQVNSQASVRGARGTASGRNFDPANAGGPIRKLSADRIKIKHNGIDVVERHVSRFGKDLPNEAQIARLRDIADGKIEPTPSDRNFYAHELREYVRYRRNGYEKGLPKDPGAAHKLWEDTHTAALEDYGVKEGPGALYHPDIDPWTPGSKYYNR